MTEERRSAVRPFRFGWALGVFRPRLWSWSWLDWTAFFLMPLVSGWLLKVVFDRLSSGDHVNGLLLGIGVAEGVRWMFFATAVYVVVRWWATATTLLRTNMLDAQTASGGSRARTLPGSPSEAITRFQDDARDAVQWTDSWLDGVATLGFSVVALGIMSTINAGAAFVVLVPMVAVTVVTRALMPRVFKARLADREASSAVTSFLGETFTAALAFRLAGREDAAVQRLARHTAVRRRTAVRDSVLRQAIDGMSASTTDVMIGLSLLVLVPAVRAGDFSVGDLALFVAYAVQLGELPRYAARVITAHEQSIIAYDRMGELVAADDIEQLIESRAITIEPNDVMLTRKPDPIRVPLEHLTVRGLTAFHADTGGGAFDIDLDIKRGQFVVITGGVGAGKSTLLRALVGLMPTSDGTITWNDQIVADPASWCVPPNAAHLPQLPRLFSESLMSNITLGRDDAKLDDTLTLTTLDRDLSEMPQGQRTLVGARGLRLSGGQAQRVAVARSLLTQPELLVVDDLSSALDVHTERELWTRLSVANDSTVIAVSHRALALERADQVVTMDLGRIVSISQR